MTTEELLVAHPLTTNAVKEWLYKKMMETMDETTIDPDFKEMMFNDSLNDHRVSILLDAQPSSLFELFDSHNILVSVHARDKEDFSGSIGTMSIAKTFTSRKALEMELMIIGFHCLEQKLQLVELPNLES